MCNKWFPKYLAHCSSQYPAVDLKSQPQHPRILIYGFWRRNESFYYLVKNIFRWLFEEFLAYQSSQEMIFHFVSSFIFDILHIYTWPPSPFSILPLWKVFTRSSREYWHYGMRMQGQIGLTGVIFCSWATLKDSPFWKWIFCSGTYPGKQVATLGDPISTVISKIWNRMLISDVSVHSAINWSLIIPKIQAAVICGRIQTYGIPYFVMKAADHESIPPLKYIDYRPSSGWTVVRVYSGCGAAPYIPKSPGDSINFLAFPRIYREKLVKRSARWLP